MDFAFDARVENVIFGSEFAFGADRLWLMGDIEQVVVMFLRQIVVKFIMQVVGVIVRAARGLTTTCGGPASIRGGSARGTIAIRVASTTTASAPSTSTTTTLAFVGRWGTQIRRLHVVRADFQQLIVGT